MADGKELDFNTIWSSKNYQPCNDTENDLDETASYPILNGRFSVNVSQLEAESENINERISNSIKSNPNWETEASTKGAEIPEVFDADRLGS